MLPRDQRLRSNKDYRRVYSRAKSHVHPLAVLYVMPRTVHDASSAGLNCSRVGFVVSKKQGGAVLRNRIRRRLRAAVMARIELPQGYDMVFVGRKPLITADWAGVTSAIDELLQKAGFTAGRLRAAASDAATSTERDQAAS